MIKQAPDVPAYRWYQALAYGNRSEAEERADRPRNAERDIVAQMDIVRSELNKAIENGARKTVQNGMQSYYYYCCYLCRQGRYAEAMSATSDVQTFCILAARHIPSFVDEYRDHWIALQAFLFDRFGRYDESDTAWNQLLGINPIKWSLLPRLGTCLSLAGKGTLSDSELQAMETLIGQSPDAPKICWHTLARLHARRSLREPDATRRNEIEKRAVDCLRHSADGSDLLNWNLVVSPNLDPDFASLRARKDFVEVVAAFR
jgi:hypothetical protein